MLWAFRATPHHMMLEFVDNDPANGARGDAGRVGAELATVRLESHFTGCYVKPAEDRSGLGEFLEVTPVQT